MSVCVGACGCVFSQCDLGVLTARPRVFRPSYCIACIALFHRIPVKPVAGSGQGFAVFFCDAPPIEAIPVSIGWMALFDRASLPGQRPGYTQVDSKTET